MRIVTSNEMKEIENQAEKEFLFDESLIIENVGVEAANLFEHQVGRDSLSVIFLIGKGSNGADGLAFARNLANRGHKIRAFMCFSKEECSAELINQAERADRFGVLINETYDMETITSFCDQISGPLIVIDALFGTGVRLPLPNFITDIVNYMNDRADLVVSIDIPSGVEGDTGFTQGAAIKADLTYAISLPKIGYYMDDGPRHVGKVEILDIGLPKKLTSSGDKFLLDLNDVYDVANKRDKFGDKKVFGHTLAIGGSHGLTGALVLTSQSALKVGAGLVTAATWEPQYQELIFRLIPEVMTGYVPLDMTKWPRLISDLNKYSSIVIGPGLARSTRARKLVLDILANFQGPVVVDADAINILDIDEDEKVFKLRNAPTVLTPHFGEFARFSKTDLSELKRRPVEFLQQTIERINCTVVLKGACTYIGMSSGEVGINYYPNDGMATGGVGDVLAGILGGLLGQNQFLKDSISLSQKYEKFNELVGLGVWIHSEAGRVAQETLGVRSMTATSLVESFSDVFKLMDGQTATEVSTSAN